MKGESSPPPPMLQPGPCARARDTTAGARLSSGPCGNAKWHRRESAVGFRGWIRVDAQEGDKTPDGHPVFPAEDERYHLVVSAGCPFSHRATVLRALKGLEVTRARVHSELELVVPSGYSAVPRAPSAGSAHLMTALVQPGTSRIGQASAERRVSQHTPAQHHPAYRSICHSISSHRSESVRWA